METLNMLLSSAEFWMAASGLLSLIMLLLPSPYRPFVQPVILILQKLIVSRPWVKAPPEAQREIKPHNDPAEAMREAIAANEARFKERSGE